MTADAEYWIYWALDMIVRNWNFGYACCSCHYCCSYHLCCCDYCGCCLCCYYCIVAVVVSASIALSVVVIFAVLCEILIVVGVHAVCSTKNCCLCLMLAPLGLYWIVDWFCPWWFAGVALKLLRCIVEWWKPLQLSIWHLYLLLHCPLGCSERQLGHKCSCHTVYCLSYTFPLKNCWHFPKLWLCEPSGQFFVLLILCWDLTREWFLSLKELLLCVRGISSHASAYLSIQFLKWIRFGWTSSFRMTFSFHFIIIAGESFSLPTLRTADDCRFGVNSCRRKVWTSCRKKAAKAMKLSGLSVEGLGQRSNFSRYAAVTSCGLPNRLFSSLIASL